MPDTTKDEYQQKLTPERYEVLRQGSTERAFSSHLNHNHETGVYMCGACSTPLFNSKEKYDSGSGWPSFTDPIPGAVEFLEDTSHGMHRVEVRCSTCHSHLGHVFPDGPGESGQRFCINGLALDFEKKDDENQKK
jgi:peptide-methionine (R)-S-oxide reductase